MACAGYTRSLSETRARCQARTRTLRDKSLSLGARVLYGILDDYAGTKAECWPHQRTAAADIGRSVRSVKRWIAELVAAGYISIKRTQNGNRYRLTWATVPEINESAQLGPSEVPARSREYNEPDQELTVSNSNSIDASDSEAWEFGLDDAVQLFNWAAENGAG
jgi:DNA-binding MarR family transcriptional regulator